MTLHDSGVANVFGSLVIDVHQLHLEVMLVAVIEQVEEPYAIALHKNFKQKCGII